MEGISMEQSIFRELLDRLQQLLAIYQELVLVAQDKKTSIIQNQIEEINIATMKETKLIKPVPELETGIRAHMTKLQRELGFRPKLKMTLSELAQLLTNPDEKQLITNVHRELGSVSGELQRANELNQQLIQQSLQYVHFSLDVLCGPEEEELTYKRPTMNQEPLKRTGIYDAKY